MELIAHRGACFDAPENSLQAFELAIHQGAHRVEFDVHLTRDGHAVVCHDGSLERTTGTALEIEFATLDQVRQHRLPNGQPIPTLRETLELLRGRAEIDLEIKTSLATATDVILRDLQDVGMGADPFITSFDHSMLKGMRIAGFRGRTGLLIGSKSMNLRQRYYETWPLAGLRDARATDLVIHHMLLHRALKRALIRDGVGIWLWTAIEDEQKSSAQRAKLYDRLRLLQPNGVIVARVEESRTRLGISGPDRQPALNTIGQAEAVPS
jgi:glycerophosphoryl diester phosphodiesterase